MSSSNSAQAHPTGAQLDFDDIVRTQRARVSRALLRFGVQARDLQDAEQDVFMIVHRRLHEFEGRSSITTWLYRIAMNVASDHRRRAHHRREVFCERTLHEARMPARCEAERRDTLQHIGEALDALDEDKREVFLLYELEELSMLEVAKKLRLPLKTAFSRLYAARRALHACLRDERLSLFAWWWPSRLGDDVFAEASRSAALKSSAFGTLTQLAVVTPVVLCAWLLPLPANPQSQPVSRSPSRMQAPLVAAATQRSVAVPSIVHGSIEMDVVAITAQVQAPKRAAKKTSALPVPQPEPSEVAVPVAEPQLATRDLSYYKTGTEELRPLVLPDSAITTTHALPCLPRIVFHGKLPTILAQADAAR